MRRHPRSARFLAPALALGLVAGAAACSADKGDDVTAPELQLVAGLQPVDDCAALLDRLQEAALARVGPYGFGQGPYYFDGFNDSASFNAVGGQIRSSADDASEAPPVAATTATTAAGDPDVSGTNVQEAGVDEPDIVKADGERILAVAGGELHWIDITGAEPVVAGSVTLPEGYGQQLLVAGDQALVLVTGDSYGPFPIEGDVLTDRFVPTDEPFTTTLAQVDLSAPAAMAVTNTLEVEGSIVDARLVGDIARVVASSPPENLNFVYPSNPTPEAEAIAEEANQRVIKESEIADWVPAYRHVNDPAGSDEAIVDEGSLVECDRMRTPLEFSGFGTISVLTIDVAGALGIGDAVGVLASSEHVYASSNHLYVATTTFPDADDVAEFEAEAEAEAEAEEQLAEDPTTTTDDPVTTTTDDGETTTTVEDASTDTTTTTSDDDNDADTDAPTTTVPDGPAVDDFAATPPAPTTAIHRFSIEGDEPADYERSGEVRGRLLDQFSMSEQPAPGEGDDLLRVATTDDATSESYVTVLSDGGGEMLPVGQVGGLGEGEEIYSVRFVGDMGYVVTFRQTDPLYTIDLSDPTEPTVAGELKILGYSAYLHPLGGDLLLGIGQDATAEGRTTGTQLSLFDVSDPADPTRLQNVTLPGASSEAEYDHHAFLYWPETGLAVLPIQSFSAGEDVFCAPEEGCAPSGSFNGAVGFQVSPDAIDEVGRITHDDGSTLSRSVVVGDTLYTLSDTSLVASDLATLTPESTLPLS